MYLISVYTHFNYDDISLCCCLHYASIHPYGDCPHDLEPGGHREPGDIMKKLTKLTRADDQFLHTEDN